MAEYRCTTNLKNELKQEEDLLKKIKDKLVDQLQRLKVEELALVNCISVTSSSSNLSQTSSSTATFFNMKECTGDMDTMNAEINSVPLSGLSDSLASNSLILGSQPSVEEEEDED